MPLERCHMPCLDAGRRWERGEVRAATKVDETGEAVPTSEWWRLVRADELVRDDERFDDEEVKERRRESGARDKTAAIQSAVQRLDPENSRHWTKDGYPAVGQVSVLSGLDVTRAEISAACPDFERPTLADRG